MHHESGRDARCTTVRVELLDGFACSLGAGPLELAPSAQRLLAFLAVHEGNVGRGVVLAALWPERDDRRGSGNLRSVLWRLPDRLRAMIMLRDGELSLNGVSCDVTELIARARSLLDGTETLNDMSSSEFAADLLPSWYDDWVIVERERLRQIRVHALEELSRQLTAAARYGEAIESALAAIAADCLRETAHRRLIEAHLAEGNASEAIRQYNLYAGLLSSQLGIDPSAELRRLIDGVRR